MGVPVGRHSGSRPAMTSVATISDIIFFLFFPVSFFLHCLLFSQRECSDQKTYLLNVDGSPQKPKCRDLSKTPSAILGFPSSHFEFCRRCGVAGGERVSPAPLGWYLDSPHKSLTSQFVCCCSLKLLGNKLFFEDLPTCS